MHGEENRRNRKRKGLDEFLYVGAFQGCHFDCDSPSFFTIRHIFHMIDYGNGIVAGVLIFAMSFEIGKGAGL